MTRPAAKGKTLWPALVAAAALLLTAPQAFASRTAATRPELLPGRALESPATTAALGPAYSPQGFELHASTDPHPRHHALFPALTPPPAAVEPEKLASGVESWELAPNLQRIQVFVAETWQVRENLGPVDSPNLYQAFGLDPQNNTDPLGLCFGIGGTCVQWADAIDKWLQKRSSDYCGGDLRCMQLRERAGGNVIRNLADLLRAGSEVPAHLDAAMSGNAALARETGQREVMRITGLFLLLSPALEAAAARTAAMAELGATKIPGQLVLAEDLGADAAGSSIAVTRPPVYTTAQANALPGPNRGLIWVRENLGDPRTPAQVAAREFEDATPGWFVDPASGDKAVPALRYDNPNPGNSFVRLDGLTSPVDLVDAKTRLLTFESKGSTIIPQASDLRRLSEAARQNPGYSVTIEFSDSAALAEGRRVLRQLRIPRIETRVRQ